MPLERSLGLPALTFYGVGIILGAGIYSVLGVAAGPAGNGLWLSFLLSSAVALLTALSYAELATTWPRAGAEFTYLRQAAPGWPGVALVTGLLVALSGAATAATVALAFAGYLHTFVDLPDLVVAWVMLAAVAGVNLVGVRASAWVNVIFTVLEAGGLVLFVAVGALSGQLGTGLVAVPDGGIVVGAGIVFFAFLGFQNIANLAEEARRPERDVPRSIFASLAIATTLYVLVALAAVALLPPEELARSKAPLADAARTVSPGVADVLGAIALFATANTALVAVLVASRVVYGIARDGLLPARLALLLPGRNTPWVATVAVTAVAAVLAPFGDIGAVASLSSFAALLSFAAVNVALIVLRYRDPDVHRPFRVPIAVGRFPILPAVAVVSTLAVATQVQGEVLVGGIAALALFSGFAAIRRATPTGVPPPA